MNEASTHARKLAEEHGIDLTSLEGTGNEGLITKQDVEAVIGRDQAQKAETYVGSQPEEAPTFTNIMEAQVAAREGSIVQAGEPIPASVDVEIAIPTQQELMALIAEMREEIGELRAGQAHIVEREHYERDLTDELYFITKPNGHKWEERRVIDKQTVVVEFSGTAFIGPFEDSDMIDTYLGEKRSKREDSYLDWQNVGILLGRDARALDRQEKAAREAQFVQEETNIATNVLDRRMWAKNGWGEASESGQGEVVGPAA
jgi:hypothetical protein